MGKRIAIALLLGLVAIGCGVAEGDDEDEALVTETVVPATDGIGTSPSLITEIGFPALDVAPGDHVKDTP